MLDSQMGSREGAIDYSLLLDGLIAEREQASRSTLHTAILRQRNE